MTFSIAARCAETGAFALAVSSSSPAVAARCAHVRAGVGAVASQNITDPSLGPRGLDLMQQGASAPEAIARLAESAPHVEYRQLAAVDAAGRTAHFSGAKTLGLHATASAENAVAAGNLLANEEVPAAMVAAFLAAEGHIAARALAALQAALEAGGEEGPVHSAGLVVVDKVSWPSTDLRVDWRDDDPIGELSRLWALWAPQEEAYVTRALDPASAPTYGVPGDA